MEQKSWRESYTELQRLVLPADTNIYNALYGGRLVEWIDNVASIVATKHSRRRAVTGSIDSLFFLSPPYTLGHRDNERQAQLRHQDYNGDTG